MRKLIAKATSQLHSRIFGHAMSPTMSTFLGNLTWSFSGYIAGGLIIFVVSIIAGRILGPAGYGDYNLILAIGSFLAVLMFFGCDTTSVKFISSSKNTGDKKRVISNSIIFTSISSLALLVLVVLFSGKISELLNTTQALVIFGALCGLITMFNLLTDDFIKSLQLFKFQSSINILQSTITLILFIAFFFILHRNSYIYYFAITMFSALVVTTIYFIRIRGMVGTWSSAMWKSTSPYWKLTLGVSFIGVTIGSIDKFFLSHYLGAAELGLYSAYLLSSTLIVGHIVSALANVFSPTINSIGNQGVALKKIDRLMMVGFIPIILSVYIISLIIIKLFGAQYQLNYWFVAIVALTAFLQIVAGFYGSLISSSENLYRMSTKIYFFKPVAIGLLVLILMLNPDIISLYTIFLFGIILYLYDIISTRLCFALVRAY